MITLSRPIEQPLYDLLHRRFPRPTSRDALQCLQDEEVQDAAVKLAEEMRKLAIVEDEHRKQQKKPPINWRNFYVSSVGIGIMLSPQPKRSPYDWFVFSAFNSKPSKKADKYCAEMRVMRAAKSSRCVCLGGLVVVALPQADSRSGKNGITLDPCPECRDMIRSEKFRYLYRDTTLLLTAQPESQVRALRRLPQLMSDHNEKWPPLHQGGAKSQR